MILVIPSIASRLVPVLLFLNPLNPNAGSICFSCVTPHHAGFDGFLAAEHLSDIQMLVLSSNSVAFASSMNGLAVDEVLKTLRLCLSLPARNKIVVTSG